jgi:hypothetical protein
MGLYTTRVSRHPRVRASARPTARVDLARASRRRRADGE